MTQRRTRPWRVSRDRSLNKWAGDTYHPTMDNHGARDVRTQDEAFVAIGPFVLDRARGLLLDGQKEVEIPRRSLRLLEVLVDSAGETVSKDRLVSEAWRGAFVSDTSLTEAVSRLRRALRTNAREQRYIRTIHGRGYRLTLPPAPGPEAATGFAWWRIAASVASLVLLGALSVSELGLNPLSNSPTDRRPPRPRYRLAEVALDGSSLVEYGVPSLPLKGFSVDRTEGRVAFSMANGDGSDAWVYEPERGELRSFATGGRFLDPVWRPGGQAVALAEHRNGSFDLVLKEVDSEHPPQVLLEAEFDQYPESWSRDGRSLVFSQKTPATGYDLWLLRQHADGSWQPVALVETAADEAFGAISPDGRYVAFASMRGPRSEILVADLGSERAPFRVSRSGGGYPFWSQSGDLLHYVEGDALLTVPASQLSGGAIRDPHRSNPVAGLYLAGSTRNADRIVVATLEETAIKLR